MDIRSYGISIPSSVLLSVRPPASSYYAQTLAVCSLPDCCIRDAPVTDAAWRQPPSNDKEYHSLLRKTVPGSVDIDRQFVAQLLQVH